MARSFVVRSFTHSTRSSGPLPADVADERMLVLQRREASEQMGAHGLGVLTSSRPQQIRSSPARRRTTRDCPRRLYACAPGGHDMTSARATCTRRAASPTQFPWPSPGCRADAKMLDREHLARCGPCPTGPRRRRASSRASWSAPQPLDEHGRGHDVAALPLNGFDDDRGDLVG